MKTRSIENMRGGFTLVELLVASALSAVLMVAVLHVASGTHQSAKAMPSHVEHQWFEELCRVLRDDLSAAASLEPTDDGCLIDAPSQYVPATMVRVAWPTTVRYRLDEQRHVLFREQFDQTRVPREPWSQVLATGVIAFTLSVPSSLAPMDGVGGSGMTRGQRRPNTTLRIETDTGQSKPAPPARLTIKLTLVTGASLEQTLLLDPRPLAPVEPVND